MSVHHPKVLKPMYTAMIEDINAWISFKAFLGLFMNLEVSLDLIFWICVSVKTDLLMMDLYFFLRTISSFSSWVIFLTLELCTNCIFIVFLKIRPLIPALRPLLLPSLKL